MSNDMHFKKGQVLKDVGADVRMDTHAELSISQLLTLPVGSELIAVGIAPFGIGLRVSQFLIDDRFKEEIVTPAFHEACGHGLSRAEMEESLFPGSFFVTLTPENYAPDMSELLNERFVRKGYKDGVEGMPMMSSSALQNKFKEDWHDTAYAAYTASYKRGTENRKKGR
jgi:hypothetical protein